MKPTTCATTYTPATNPDRGRAVPDDRAQAQAEQPDQAESGPRQHDGAQHAGLAQRGWRDAVTQRDCLAAVTARVHRVKRRLRSLIHSIRAACASP
jgi:hypothetical protein